MGMKKIAAATLVAVSIALAPQVASAQGLMDLGRYIIGLPQEEKPEIDYRERAPLVVPPNQNLRPPSEGGTAEQRRANWPQDPDVAARRRAAEEARRPVFSPTDAQQTRVFTPDEQRAMRRAGVNPGTPPQQPLNDRGVVQMLEGATMPRTGTAAGANDGPYVEPKREYLTDPPLGTRAAAGTGPVRATRDNSVRPDIGRPDMLGTMRDGPNTR
jgi:hypothetical protein